MYTYILSSRYSLILDGSLQAIKLQLRRHPGESMKSLFAKTDLPTDKIGLSLINER